MGLLIILIALITVILFVWRYLGWMISLVIAHYFGCDSVRLGKCGFFYVQHIKLTLRSGIRVEIDELRLSSSFFNAQFTKPIMLTIGDMRIEGEKRLNLSENLMAQKQSSQQMKNKNVNNATAGIDVERWLHWLQYAGAMIRTARIVFIDAVPRCLLHSTFETVQLDAFRDREGMQLELSCRLAQAKLFTRGRTTPLLELSLTIAFCADLTISNIRLRRISVSITNPFLSLSDGLLEYLHENPIVLGKNDPSTVVTEETSDEADADGSESDAQSRSRLFRASLLSNIKLDVNNLVFRYIAQMDSEMNTRTVSVSLGNISALLERDNCLSMALTAIDLLDQSPRSHFKCTDFVVNVMKEDVADAKQQRRHISLVVRVLNPCLLVCQNDLSTWIEYAMQMERRLSPSTTGFDDDFSSSNYSQDGSNGSRESSPSKVAAATANATTTHTDAYSFSVSAEINTLQSRLMTLDSRDIYVGIDLITFNANNNFSSVEVGVEYLWVRRGASLETTSPFSFERHVWGNAVVLGAALAQFSHSTTQKLQVQLDECHFEYEDELAQQITSFICALLPSKEGSSLNRKDSWKNVPNTSPQRNTEFIVQISAKKLAVFLTARQASYVVVAVDHARLDAMPGASTVWTFDNLKIGQGQIANKETVCWDSDGAMITEHVCGEGGCLKARTSVTLNTLNLVVLAYAPVALVWDPVVHIVLLETYRSAMKIRSDFFTKRLNRESSEPMSASPSSSRVFTFVIDTSYPVKLQFRLPREHIMCWEVPSLHIERDENITYKMPTFIARMDTHPILTLEKFSVQRRAIDARMDLGRAEFKNLMNRTNKVWCWAADSFALLFPYGYNFASAFDELINAWKWIKLVHDLKQKPFTVDSPLPSDLSFSIKHASFQMNDDPFEVQLQSNYELMVDEVYECERRRRMLDQKLEQLRKQHPLLTQSKCDELHRSLLKKNSEIYVERSKKTPQARTHLVIWTITNLEIHAYADRSLHGKENAVNLLRKFNPEAPYPSEGMDFSTLWARAVELDFNEWRIQFRDYPLPYQMMRDGHFWGHLVGAEHLAGNRSIRSCKITLPEPWGEYTVDRNMCPLKYYYDLECEIADLNATYGPCWEPCLSMISLCWNNVSAPSSDPSAVLPFWDKIRLLFHGRLSMLCKHLVTSMLATTDPYNDTELVEISWKDFEFDWTTGQLCMQTDVDTFVRTASKYDDSRVLHLPGFKFSVLMDWACIGDPYDHHSAQPCAPDKLPDYASTNHEHDSYRAFRSTHLDLILNIEVKPQSELASDSQYPQILLYANTFRWLEFLKNTMTTVNRPIRKGTLFGANQSKKRQLIRHYKHIRLNVTLPRFLISYWMSFSSSHGFRMISESLHLTSSMQLHIIPSNNESHDGVTRRLMCRWTVSHVSAQLANVQMHLFGDSSRPMSDKFITKNNDDTFFVGLDRLSYIRESMPQNQHCAAQNGLSDQVVNDDGTVAVHRLTIHDLRASWTPENRDTCLAIADGIQKAHILRKILSNDVLKVCNFTELTSTQPATVSRSVSANCSKVNSTRQNNNDGEKSPGRSRFGSEGRMVEENDMLQKLINEASTKLVAYSEEATDVPSDSLHGIGLCNADDVFLTNWQIDLINSQAVLRGKELDGFVLLTAARASVTQRFHLPVWKKSQLLDKRSWCAILTGMQYFAPLVMSHNHQPQQSAQQQSANGSPQSTSAFSSSATLHKESHHQQQQFRWLSRDVIEEKACSDPNISDKLDNYISTGEAVGGVVAEHGSPATQSSGKLQLQRVVSRCSCQIYFCYFTDTLDIDTHNMPLPMADLGDEHIWGQREPVDCFTLKHNMLEVSTNPQQYEMVMNIINQLVLFVDPRKKEMDGCRQRLRFQWLTKSADEVKTAILSMQAELRDNITVIRSMERRGFFLNRQLLETPNDSAVLEANSEVTAEIEELKKKQIALSDDLAMTISCYKEKQVERMRQLVDYTEDEHVLVARRFEVCFEDCIWRLTESDGQIALAEMQIRNFLYTRTVRIDNSGEHLLEVGTVKVTNLLPDSIYTHTLQAQNTSQTKTERQPSIRVVCRDKAPVGGICVKEHFEINVSPMVAQLTYRFFEKMMAYFFPGRNIDKEDQKDLDTNDDQQMVQSVSVRQWLRGAVNGSFRRTAETNRMRDDIDRMKERAQNNNVFLYIKIPEVPFIVSYKGFKDKNIEDVDRFQLVFPLCEYHDKNWTWLDLALAIKQRCRRVLIQQFMKQKLLRNRLMGAAEQDACEVDEEEKKRIVLGPAIFPDKDKKKSKKSG